MVSGFELDQRRRKRTELLDGGAIYNWFRSVDGCQVLPKRLKCFVILLILTISLNLHTSIPGGAEVPWRERQRVEHRVSSAFRTAMFMTCILVDRYQNFRTSSCVRFQITGYRKCGDKRFLQKCVEIFPDYMVPLPLGALVFVITAIRGLNLTYRPNRRTMLLAYCRKKCVSINIFKMTRKFTWMYECN